MEYYHLIDEQDHYYSCHHYHHRHHHHDHEQWTDVWCVIKHGPLPVLRLSHAFLLPLKCTKVQPSGQSNLHLSKIHHCRQFWLVLVTLIVMIMLMLSSALSLHCSLNVKMSNSVKEHMCESSFDVELKDKLEDDLDFSSILKGILSWSSTVPLIIGCRWLPLSLNICICFCFCIFFVFVFVFVTVQFLWLLGVASSLDL